MKVLPVALAIITVAVVVTFHETHGFKIAAFNVQVFGQTKAKKADVMEVLTKVIKRYDIILIQEIRDKAETAIFDLLDLVNSEGDLTYDIVVSARLGRTSSKEQYAYIYKTGVGIEVTQTYQYPDPGDLYQREPFAVKFSISELDIDDLAIAGIHTEPGAAVHELDLLDKVNDGMETEMDSENIMLMGDFNADCTYVTKSEMPDLVLRKKEKYHWLIEDDADTTTKSTNCAYDRFVVNGEKLFQMVVPGSAKVFRFDTEYGLDEDLTTLVSDHYPIEVELSADASLSNRSAEKDSIINLIKALTRWLDSAYD